MRNVAALQRKKGATWRKGRYSSIKINVAIACAKHIWSAVCRSWCMQKPKNIAQLAPQHRIHNNEWQSGSGKYWKRFEFSYCETQSRHTANILESSETAERWGIIRSDARNKTNKHITQKRRLASDSSEKKEGKKVENIMWEDTWPVAASVRLVDLCLLSFLTFHSLCLALFLTNNADKHSSMGLASDFDYIKNNSSGNSSPLDTQLQEETSWITHRFDLLYIFHNILVRHQQEESCLLYSGYYSIFNCSALITTAKYRAVFGVVQICLSVTPVIMWLSGRRRRVAIEIEAVHCTWQKKSHMKPIGRSAWRSLSENKKGRKRAEKKRTDCRLNVPNWGQKHESCRRWRADNRVQK